MEVPERVRWVVEVVDPKPGERILEIGPGPGVAAALDALDGGGPQTADRITKPIAAALAARGFAEVAVSSSAGGIAVSGRAVG